MAKKYPTEKRYGTPIEIVEIARRLMGGIDLDPASSSTFNQIVQAKKIYTEADDGLVQDWEGNVFVNPPGGLYREFWGILMSAYASGAVKRFFWVGFNVEQLLGLAASGSPYPWNFPLVLLKRRLRFLNHETLAPAPSPRHGNYLVIGGVSGEMVAREFRDYGVTFRGGTIVGESDDRGEIV